MPKKENVKDGNDLVHLTSQVKAKRITVNTTITDVL